MVADAASLPIGAVVLASDGADNSGGVDLETMSEIRRQRIPIHTIGFGKEQAARDVEISDVQVPARALPDSRLSAIVSFHQNGYAGREGQAHRQGRREDPGAADCHAEEGRRRNRARRCSSMPAPRV